MHIRVASLALPVVIGIGVVVTSCSSAPGTANPAVSATRSVSGVPAGYTRVGGAAQGISIAAPSSWVTVNLAKESIQSAARKVSLSGISTTTFVQAMEPLQVFHAVAVFDAKSAVDSPRHFARSLNAYCVSWGASDPGAAAVPLVKEIGVTTWEKLGATHITQKDLQIGGVPGVETSYQFSSSTEGTTYESQLEVVPKRDKACLVTVIAVKGEPTGNVISVAAATAQFP